MRSILISVLLIIVVISIYQQTVGGDNGTRDQVRDTGGRVNQSIERINP